MQQLNKLIADSIHSTLTAIGLRTLYAQFSFSYFLIFALALTGAISIYTSLGNSAQTINVAGKQRMLSQRLAKETLLVKQDIISFEQHQKTLKEFEQAHRDLTLGNEQKGIEPPSSDKVAAQLKTVEQNWQQYKKQISNYLNSQSNDLNSLNTASIAVLTSMHQTVLSMADDANATVKQQQILSFFTTIGILILVILGRAFGMSRLMHNIAKVQHGLIKVSDGDFSHKLEENIIEEDNEMGQTISAYNQMLVQVSDIINHVNTAYELSSAGTEKVKQATLDTADGVKRQHIEIDQVAVAMNEMTATVEEVAQSAQRASDAADEAEQTVSTGYETVNATQECITRMAEQVSSASEIITSLEQDNKRVGTFLEVITGIAEQTNLLALNAAIEAARAGEQGRGFAVVADEVRSLAAKTQESAKEISIIIEQLQAKSNQAVKAVEQTTEQAQQSVTQTQHANDALEHIVSSVNIIRDMNMQIATAAEEQHSVTKEMDRNITGIAAIATETINESEAMIQATDEIVEEMGQLKTTISRFHAS